MSKISITKEEYEELLSYKQAFIDLCSLKKKAGKAYEDYKDMKNMAKFFVGRYGEMYKNMVNTYNDMKRY